MEFKTLFTVLLSAFSLIGIWHSYWEYVSYREDRFRHKMFQLRNELFDLASTGEINFDHPAYGMLRVTMNGYIRFTHRITPLNIFLIFAVSKVGNKSESKFEEEWEKHLVNLDGKLRALLLQKRQLMNSLVFKHSISSPLFMVLLFLFFPIWVLVKNIFKAAALVKSAFDTLESLAMDEGKSAHQQATS